MAAIRAFLSRRGGDLRQIALITACGVLLLLPVALLLGRPPREPQLTLIGIGDSLSLLLEGAGGGRVVVGGGAAQSELAAALGRHLPPWDRRIDLLVVADRRDLPGATELARRGLARSVVTVGLADQRAAAAGLETLRAACAARNIPLRAIQAVERVALGRGDGLTLTIAPPENATGAPSLRLRLGALDAPILLGAAGEAPATGAILPRASQEGYRLALGNEARLIVAPAPPGNLVVAAPEGRQLLIVRAGQRTTLVASDGGLRLRGAALDPLDAATVRR